MNIAEIIQNIATGSAVALGLTYILGGLIVNLNLARRGIVEFQIVKVRYLVAGIIFLLQALGAYALAFIGAVAALLMDIPNEWLQALNILSMIAAGSLLLAWVRLPSNTKSPFASWSYWLSAATLGAIFPALILVRHILVRPPMNFLEIVLVIQAMLTSLLTTVGQIYHYAAFYYGRPSGVVGALDPIGVGIPSRVRIACTRENIPLFKSLGIALDKQNVTQDLFLIDETDHNYILAFEAVPGADKSAGTIKMDKALVKAILFLPETMG